MALCCERGKKQSLQVLMTALQNFSVAVIMGAKPALEYYSSCACSTCSLLLHCWYSPAIKVRAAVIGSLGHRLQLPASCC